MYKVGGERDCEIISASDFLTACKKKRKENNSKSIVSKRDTYPSLCIFLEQFRVKRKYYSQLYLIYLLTLESTQIGVL